MGCLIYNCHLCEDEAYSRNAQEDLADLESKVLDYLTSPHDQYMRDDFLRIITNIEQSLKAAAL